jgi:hypothetical protein
MMCTLQALGRCWFRSVLVASGIAVSACASDTGAKSEDDVTEVPETGARDQKDTGNCWLYATAGWAESLEYAQLIADGRARVDDPTTRPFHLSVAYWDYWDWYSKLVSGEVKGKKAAVLKDQLDSGGSWGAAVEIAERYGITRSRALVGDDVSNEATHTLAALDTMVASLTSGPLKSAASRRNRSLVRSELDRAFGFQSGVTEAITAAFGDGSRTFLNGTAVGNAVIKDPASLKLRVPHPSGQARTVSLKDVIGVRAQGDDPDHRTGPYAWNVVSFVPGTPQQNRDYFRRIQRVLHQNAPLPISWYVASNGDEGHEGQYLSIPSTPADKASSNGHETLIDDYDVDAVPGFGHLAAGTVASEAQKSAALSDESRVLSLRVKNSWGRTLNAYGPAGYNDLHVDYLTGKLRVCPKGARATDSRCEDQVPLEDVTMPAGF